MFEYLMPSLVMRAPAGSLLEQTNRLIVAPDRLRDELGLPWGISESAYNARDLEFTYQYSNFGVPGLGLKRGWAKTWSSRPTRPRWRRWSIRDAALTQSRSARAGSARKGATASTRRWTIRRRALPEGESVAIVRAFMAHHQGMTIVAIADALLDGAMRARFHAEPIVQATELLLQERMPRDVAGRPPWAAEVKSAAGGRDVEPSGGRRFASAQQATPATHLLSNGRYATMLTAAGSGYSRWGDMARDALARGRDLRRFGVLHLSRDVRSGERLVGGFPAERRRAGRLSMSPSTRTAPSSPAATASLTTTLEVIVSAEDDAEVRRVSITKPAARPRDIEITSYAELVLAPQAPTSRIRPSPSCSSKPNIFADVGAILATRADAQPGASPRSGPRILPVVDGEAVGEPEFETDRARFLGRGHSRPRADRDDRRPAALEYRRHGARSDLRLAPARRVAPGATVRVAFWTMVARPAKRCSTRRQASRRHRLHRAPTLAWTQAQVQLHHLGMTAGEAACFSGSPGM